MEYTTLGRTGMRVSVAGLGCGGHSRLGTATGKSEAESIAVVRTALDLGTIGRLCGFACPSVNE